VGRAVKVAEGAQPPAPLVTVDVLEAVVFFMRRRALSRERGLALIKRLHAAASAQGAAPTVEAGEADAARSHLAACVAHLERVRAAEPDLFVGWDSV
jgi:hypothetical protein